jgi:hypothetical protein
MFHKRMERNVPKLMALAMLLTAASPTAVNACDSPKSVGGWIGGAGDVVSNEIKTINTLESKDTGNALGWFYFLANGQMFFQPSFTVVKKTTPGGHSTSFVAATNKNGAPSVRVANATAEAAAKAVMHLASIYGVAQNDIPEPWLDLVRGRPSTIVARCN